MNRDAVIKQLMVTFLGELDDHVRALERQHARPGEGPGRRGTGSGGSRHCSVRSTVSRAARSVNLDPIAEACHLLEEVLTAVRDGGMPPGP